MKTIFIILILNMIYLNAMAQLSEIEKKILNLGENHKADSVMLLLKNNINNTKANVYYFSKGRAEYELNLLDSALNDLWKLSTCKPDYNRTIAYAYIGRVYLKKEQKDSAIFYLKKSVDLADDEWSISFANETLKEIGNNYGVNKINNWHSIGEPTPNFDMTDMSGKRYNLESFKKTPLVLHFGTTWCGSCQTDAVGYNSFAESYNDKEIIFTHVFIGETSNSVYDFLKHYRTNMFTLLDYNGRNFEKYKSESFSSTFLIDSKGLIQFNNHDIFYNEKKNELKSILDTMLITKNNQNKKAVCTIESCDVPHNNQDTNIYELSPRALTDKSNTTWVTYYSNKEGNNNIYLRSYKNEKLIKEYAITQYASDDYSPDIAISPDQTIWLSWVSNKSGKYDIYACSLSKGVFSEQIQLTKSSDDAFHPRISSDNDNQIHLTYYKWDTIWNYSRDRDIFYKFYNGKQWSAEIRVSPTQPVFDDATDPSIICDNNKNVYIAYSYDYHPGSYKKEEKVTQPTIFLQHIKNTFDPNEQLLIGTKELVYKNVVDISPELAVDSKNAIWCVWDARTNGNRYIFAKRTTDSTETVISEKSAISTNPDIKLFNTTAPYIVWNQTKGEKWDIFGSKLENGQWTSPVKLVESLSDCKEPVLLMTKNKKYVVYVEYQNNGSKIQIKEVKNY